MFKKHVRADDFADDDEYMQHLIDAAEVAVIAATNRTAEELAGDNGGFPKPLQHAAMMLAAHWYNQRESVSTAQMHEVPDALQALIKPYRKLADDASRTDEIQA